MVLFSFSGAGVAMRAEFHARAAMMWSFTAIMRLCTTWFRVVAPGRVLMRG